MSEPREVAEVVERVVDGVYHWRIRNSAIGGAISSSHAVVVGDECVLVDPVAVETSALETLPHPTAIVLSAVCHQRAAWRLRREFGVPVWLPTGAPESEEEPDHHYGDGDVLPGTLRAVHTPGPEAAHYAFLLESNGGTLFCPDLVGNDGSDELHLIPPEFQEDPAEAQASIARLLLLPFQVLCLDHGTPIVTEPKRALEAVLAEAAAHAPT
jgi:glyoxylase-like metal-dependent hydrolase (beta-lactamase superfamily II)